MRDRRGTSKECSSLPSCSCRQGGQQPAAAAGVVVAVEVAAERQCPL